MVLVHDPAGLLVDHLLLQPMPGPGVNLVEMRLLRLRRHRIERDGTGDQRELQRPLPIGTRRHSEPPDDRNFNGPGNFQFLWNARCRMKKLLAKYRAKRDFSKTAEPSGDADVKEAKGLRFVIQKHAASHLHYDLRLELDGVFKSWAVTKGPSLDPHDKRLAVEVEDHPLDYGDFEGTIPKGQYGGGTVQLWDRGYWESDDPDRGYKKGDLKFTLHGDKLHGSWVLVRMRNDRTGGKRTNWLLIKHRDEFAKGGKANNILDADRSVASGRTMEQIAEGKGRAPKPFMTAKSGRGKADAVWHSNRGDAAEARAEKKTEKTETAAPAAKGKRVAKIPDFVAPQLCTPVDRPPNAEGWCHEIKFDGYRVQLRIEDGEAALRTRKGLDWTEKFQAIANEASSLPDVLVDGEIVALDHA